MFGAAVDPAVEVVVAEVPRGRVDRPPAAPAGEPLPGVHASLVVGLQLVVDGVVAPLLACAAGLVAAAVHPAGVGCAASSVGGELVAAVLEAAAWCPWTHEGGRFGQRGSWSRLSWETGNHRSHQVQR